VKNKRLAAIDIGTNTFRLLIAEVLHDTRNNNFSIKEVHSERIITRLGEGMPDSSILNNNAIDRSINTLKKFSDIISLYHVHHILAVATSALRDAKNSDEFLIKAKKSTGLDIEVIEGDEEAKLTSSGMLIDIPVTKTAFMVDIGGGSTELICMEKALNEDLKAKTPKLLLVKSLNLGVVYLAGKYMKTDPPLIDDLNQMGDEISQLIMSSVNPFKIKITRDTVFIGTAGTVTALAAITQRLTRYEHDKIHNFKLAVRNVEDIFSAISTVSSEQRAKYLPFEPARLDIIVPGTLILLTLMKVFGLNEITVSNYGLREGILIELYKSIAQST
jgi:exopolyphosphatase/guanosine-5'-triphosphate,3'-diphosphate pyrophosphatase